MINGKYIFNVSHELYFSIEENLNFSFSHNQFHKFLSFCFDGDIIYVYFAYWWNSEFDYYVRIRSDRYLFFGLFVSIRFRARPT